MTSVTLLRVAETAPDRAEQIAILGRHIRTPSEKIARYCIREHEPIYEDLAALVESMAYLDRSEPRRRAEGWARRLSIEVPVYEHGQFRRDVAVTELAKAAGFLTGDLWSFESSIGRSGLSNHSSGRPRVKFCPTSMRRA
jgi:hypothetical protein